MIALVLIVQIALPLALLVWLALPANSIAGLLLKALGVGAFLLALARRSAARQRGQDMTTRRDYRDACQLANAQGPMSTTGSLAKRQLSHPADRK